jgi:hypothetical protein
LIVVKAGIVFLMIVVAEVFLGVDDVVGSVFSLF